MDSVATFVFVDACPPKPYDARTLETSATGGTTADVIILAERLAQDHRVFIVQDRPPRPAQGRATYIAVNEIDELPTPEMVVFLRGWWLIAEGGLSPPIVRQRSPACRFIFWPHVTYPQPFSTLWGWAYGLSQRAKHAKLGALLMEHDVEVVGVSDFHATTIKRLWPALRVSWIYNPISRPPSSVLEEGYDPHQIIFASSPERGFERSYRDSKASSKNDS